MARVVYGHLALQCCVGLNAGQQGLLRLRLVAGGLLRVQFQLFALAHGLQRLLFQCGALFGGGSRLLFCFQAAGDGFRCAFFGDAGLALLHQFLCDQRQRSRSALTKSRSEASKASAACAFTFHARAFSMYLAQFHGQARLRLYGMRGGGLLSPPPAPESSQGADGVRFLLGRFCVKASSAACWPRNSSACASSAPARSCAALKANASASSLRCKASMAALFGLGTLLFSHLQQDCLGSFFLGQGSNLRLRHQLRIDTGDGFLFGRILARSQRLFCFCLLGAFLRQMHGALLFFLQQGGGSGGRLARPLHVPWCAPGQPFPLPA